jgi:Fe(3+) dicitrate transport protein
VAFAYQMNLNQRLEDFNRGPAFGVTPASVPDPRALFLLQTASLRNRVYDVAGLSSELEHRFQTGGAVHRLKVGARAIEDVARRKLSSGATPAADSGQLLTDDTTRILGLSAWLEDQIALTSQFLVTPAFRYEHSSSAKTLHRVNDPLAGIQDVHIVGHSSASGAMPGIGVIYGTAKLNAFSSAYLGYSAPRVSQAITPGGQDANLHAERSKNLELGLRGRSSNWFRAEADAFAIFFDNQLVSNNPLSGTDSEFIDGGRTRHLGAEATASVRFGKALELPVDLDLAGQYTFVRARFADGTFAGRTVPYSPANSASLTLDAAHPIGVSAQLAFSYVGSQFTDEQNSLVGGATGLDGIMSAYTTLDAGARYLYRPSGVSFGLSVKSLLDRVYISDRLPNGIFTAGFRQIFATFAWSSDG